MKKILLVMILIIVVGFNSAQAQELTWVKDNFNIIVGTWAEWWGGYTSVARVVDLPNAGDKTLACTFNKTGSTDMIAAGIYYQTGMVADVADSLTMDVYFPSDFPIASVDSITFVCQPQGGSWPWYEVGFTPVLGAWNRLTLNIDSLKGVNADFANQELKVGPRIYTFTDAAGVYYIDNIILWGVMTPDYYNLDSVDNQLYTGMYGQKRFANRIKWQDYYINLNETYNIYASKNFFMDVHANGVIKLASGLPRGIQHYNHWIYSADGEEQTWYYTMTWAITEGETGMRGVYGPVTGPSTIPYIIPLVSDFSADFTLDADIGEFKTLAETYTGMKIRPEFGFDLLQGLNM
jgi:hypothetical protein